jgi:hypothetical protein
MAIELNINDSELTNILEKSINQHLEAKFSDDHFLTKLGSLVNQAVANRIEKLDIGDIVDQKVNDYFMSSIVNQSSKPQLTITDKYVVNENEFISNDVTVERDLVVKGSLSLRGRINVDNPSWDELKQHIRSSVVAEIGNQSRTDLIEDVKKSVFMEGVAIENALVNGEPLINVDTLAGKITESKLKSVGTLRELDVKGTTTLNNNTLNVLNTRIGINTEKPTMALELWDQEVAITLGKQSKDTGFIGLRKKGDLHIGVNQTGDIQIDEEGVVRINKLKIGRNTISWANIVPGYAGLLGDIVFSTNKVANGWRCTGGHNWSQF